MKRVGVLPALVTLANGYCGLLSIFKTHDGEYHMAAFLITLAMVFDVLDGMVARFAGTSSSFGAYLDSLSDAISFGVAPAFLAKASVEHSLAGVYHPKLLAFLTGVFAICALIRLARYSVEHATGEGGGKGVNQFDGIPTPGAAGVLAALVFLAYDPKGPAWYASVVHGLPWLAIALGGLMVSRVPYVHFGARFLGGRRGFDYLFVVVVVLVIVIMFPEECAAIGFCIYAVSGPVMTLFRRRGGPGAGRGDGAPEEVTIPDGL